MTNQHKLLKSFRWKLFWLGRLKIPLLHMVRPRLVGLNERECEVIIRLNRRTRNHLNSMYLAALVAGADVAAGIHAFYWADRFGWVMHFSFKSMSAEFLSRAESDVVFTTAEGENIRDMMLTALRDHERKSMNVQVEATDTEGRRVAIFLMELSFKVKSK
jgi:acyl-coenzyme A thioesterase PaaI-like protein